MTATEKSARETMEKSRMDVMECEEEIKSIKNSLKSLTAGAGSAESSLNHLEVSVHKVKVAEGGNGDADNTPTTFKINLSSPIEERTITQLYDPLNPTVEGSLAKFESIETSNALLTVEAHSNDESPRKLGVSAPHDLLPLCQDMELWRKGGEKKSSTLEITIVAEKGIDDVITKTVEEEAVITEKVEEEAVITEKVEEEVVGADAAEVEEEVKEKDDDEWEDAVDEEEKVGGEPEESVEEEAAPVPDSDEKEDKTEESAAKDDTEESEPPAAQDDSKTTELLLPLYTVTIQLEYTPSPDDKRDALYDKLNEVSKRKVAAIESLRKTAGIVQRANAAKAPPSNSSGGDKSPAVKSGFLNKSKAAEEKPPPFWKRWYGKTIGPNSMLWVVGPVAKNYVLFVGVSLLIHFKGDLLALPPPV